MLKIIKYFIIAAVLVIAILAYGIYSWHFKETPTFLSVDRKCDFIELAKEYCTNEYGQIDKDCLSGEVPQETMLYYVRDFVFGHNCTDGQNL